MVAQIAKYAVQTSSVDLGVVDEEQNEETGEALEIVYFNDCKSSYKRLRSISMKFLL